MEPIWEMERDPLYHLELHPVFRLRFVLLPSALPNLPLIIVIVLVINDHIYIIYKSIHFLNFGK